MTRPPLSNVGWWNTVSDEAGPFETLVAIVSSRQLRQIFDMLPPEFAIAVKLRDI